MHHVRPNNLSLKYQRCSTLGCKYKEIRKFELVTKTQFQKDVNRFFQNRFQINSENLLKNMIFKLKWFMGEGGVGN